MHTTQAHSYFGCLKVSIFEVRKLVCQNDFQRPHDDADLTLGIRFAKRICLIPNNLCRGLLKNEGRGEIDGKV